MPRSPSSSRSRSRSRSSASSSRSRCGIAFAFRLLQSCFLYAFCIQTYLTLHLMSMPGPPPLQGRSSSAFNAQLTRSVYNRYLSLGDFFSFQVSWSRPSRQSAVSHTQQQLPRATRQLAARRHRRCCSELNAQHELGAHQGNIFALWRRKEREARYGRQVQAQVLSLLPCFYPNLRSPALCSLGTAWVEYSDRSSCEAAIDNFDGGQVDGNTVSVKISVRAAAQREVAPPARRNWARSSPPRGASGGGRYVAIAKNATLNASSSSLHNFVRHSNPSGAARPLPRRVVDRRRAVAGGARLPGGASRFPRQLTTALVVSRAN
jgi:hypothetical protein